MARRWMIRLIATWVVIALWMPAYSQILIQVHSLPANTPDSLQLYIAGNFNDWEAAIPAHQLQPQPDGIYEILLAEPSFPLEFKFTRGSWETVEGDDLGNARQNRFYEEIALSDSAVLRLTIQSWEDLPSVNPDDSIDIQILSLPANTPPESPVYITGDFNSWMPGDATFKLKKQSDGSYRTKVPIFGNSLEFKFTRGNWETVEGRSSGRARFNRKFELANAAEKRIVTRIESWEDLSGSPINAYTFIWLLAGVLGVLLIIAINTLQNNNVASNRILSILILLISVALISRVSIYDREIFQWQPKLMLLPDVIYFLYAPVFLLYIRTLFLPSPLKGNFRLGLSILPFLLHLIAYLPFLLMDKNGFILKNVDLSLRPWFDLAGSIALIYNIFYWVYIRRVIRKFQRDSDDNYAFEQNLAFLNTVMNLKAVCLSIWLLTTVIGGLGFILNQDLSGITDRSTDLLFIVFSLTVFCLGYFAIRQPEIFKLPTESESDSDPIPDETEEKQEDLGAIKEEVSQLMKKEQPYLNPKLTLAQLAELSGTNPHLLSRVINSGFGMNFNDFVNSYRVEDFKQKVLEEKYRNHTFLAIALMVGFNSKTAFNRSFKKLTHKTPREYFKAGIEEEK